MKHLVIFFCFLAVQAFGQTSMNIGIKAGLLTGRELISSKLVETYDLGSYDDEANFNVSVPFSFPIKHNFRVTAEIGVLSFRSFLDYDFRYPTNVTELIKGRYRINQAFVAVGPEYRLFNWAYVNVGAGVYHDFNSYFTSGTRNSTDNITGLEYKRNNPFGYYAGLGICPNITKELAVLGEVRFTSSPASIKSNDDISIGYYAFNFNIGLMYKLRS